MFPASSNSLRTGGGSGVDGAGGGGGCGYIDYTAVYAPDLTRGHGRQGPDAPSLPSFFNLKFDSVSLQWARPVNGSEIHRHDVRAYDVEISQGRTGAGQETDECSFEYTRFVTLRVGVDSEVDKTTVTGLEQNTKYCARIIAVSVNGISAASPVLEVTTPFSPVNTWEVLRPRRDTALSSGRGDASGVMQRPHVHPDVETRGGNKGSNPDRTFAGPTEAAAVSPSPRRGATLNRMRENEIFLFGGMTEGYKCDDAGATDTVSEGDVSAGVEVNRCRREAGVNNDLWRLETKTGEWSVVFENENLATSPPPREGHSANVMQDGTMLVFGGKTLQAGDVTGSNKTNIFLGDMWELDIADPTTHTVTGTGSGLPSGEL